MLQLHPIPQTLDSETGLREVLKTAHEINQWGEAGDADEYLKSLRQRLEESGLRERNAQLAEAYDQVLTYLRFVTLPLLSDQEVVRLFRRHLVFGLNSDVDLKTKIELLFLVRQDDLLDRVLRRQVLHAITENDEVIGRRGITLPELSGTQSPSVRNWIIDFLRHVASGRTLSALEVQTYLSQSRNVRLLDADGQRLLRQLLSLYVFIVSEPPAAYFRQAVLSASREAASGATDTDTGGAKPAARPDLDFRGRVLQELFEEASMEDAIDAEEQRLLSGGYDHHRVVEELTAALGAGNVPKLAAALFVLARSGDLQRLLGREAELGRYVEREVFPSLLPQLKAQRSNLELGTIVEDFRRQPNRIVYLKSFLEHALTKAVGGDPHASARIGVRIASILFHQGVTAAATMAFYDAEEQTYRWAHLGVDSQGVPIIAE